MMLIKNIETPFSATILVVNIENAIKHTATTRYELHFLDFLGKGETAPAKGFTERGINTIFYYL
jgi:hypothetical protein